MDQKTEQQLVDLFFQAVHAGFHEEAQVVFDLLPIERQLHINLFFITLLELESKGMVQRLQ